MYIVVYQILSGDRAAVDAYSCFVCIFHAQDLLYAREPK